MTDFKKVVAYRKKNCKDYGRKNVHVFLFISMKFISMAKIEF